MTTLLDIHTFTNKELLTEIEHRMFFKDLQTASTDSIPPARRDPSPYDIMKAMIAAGWKEDGRKYYSDGRIDGIWDYVGYPDYTDDQSYCAGTGNACLKVTGHKMSRSIPTARSFEDYGVAVPLHEARRGDLAVWMKVGSGWKGHFAFIDDVSGDLKRIKAAGANQGNRMSSVWFPVEGPFIEGSSTKYKLVAVRRVTASDKIGEVDFKTIDKWGLDV